MWGHCRDGAVRYERLEVDEARLKTLLYSEACKDKTRVSVPQNYSFSLKWEYSKRKKEFINKLYSLLNERTIQYVGDDTDVDVFGAVLFTCNHEKEGGRICWECDTCEVYYITKKLMGYIDGLTFEYFGKLGVSKKGTVLKNLKASRTAEPRRKQDVDMLFRELDVFFAGKLRKIFTKANTG